METNLGDQEKVFSIQRRVRRADVESTHLEFEAVRTLNDCYREGVDSLEVRDAAETFIDLLPPQERAAVLMQDVFDLSLQLDLEPI